MAEPLDLGSIADFGEPRHTGDEVARRAGVDRRVADRLWRALGFPDAPEDDPTFTDEDVRALRLACEDLEEIAADRREQAIELLLSEARIASAHLANLAEAQIDAMAEMASVGLRPRLLQTALADGLESSELGWLIFYALRRQFGAALQRRGAAGGSGDGPAEQELVVGFVDLVDFTTMSRELGAGELSRLLARFEQLVFDVVAETRGRVVKLIGDEAMFVAGGAEAIDAAASILGACPQRRLPRARAGLACGSVVRKGGDYFGPTVNLASRIVDQAAPDEVWVDERLAEQAGVPAGNRCTKHLKGIGDVEVGRVEANAGDESPARRPRPRRRAQ
jgi:adenylate cyclase